MAKPPTKAERMEIRKDIGNRAVGGFDPPTRERSAEYLTAHACFACRKSWKLAENSTAICPQCGGDAHRMGRSFKAPKRTDIEQWTKVERLWRAGFRFPTNTGWREVEAYPERLSEVDEFIAANGDHPFRVKDQSSPRT